MVRQRAQGRSQDAIPAGGLRMAIIGKWLLGSGARWSPRDVSSLNKRGEVWNDLTRMSYLPLSVEPSVRHHCRLFSPPYYLSYVGKLLSARFACLSATRLGRVDRLTPNTCNPAPAKSNGIQQAHSCRCFFSSCSTCPGLDRDRTFHRMARPLSQTNRDIPSFDPVQ